VEKLYEPGELLPKVRTWGLLAVGTLWALAIGTVLVFMIRSLTAMPDDRPNPTEFTATYGPLIILATIVLPAFVAAWLVKLRREGRHVIPSEGGSGARAGQVTDHFYRALVLPLVEFVGRMGWSLVLILALVLTYRICDSIWGTFAYPFYLGELNTRTTRLRSRPNSSASARSSSGWRWAAG
jgi:PAT family beta-lactamase induction signal transducer AmpG